MLDPQLWRSNKPIPLEMGRSFHGEELVQSKLVRVCPLNRVVERGTVIGVLFGMELVRVNGILQDKVILQPVFNRVNEPGTLFRQ